MKSWGIPEKGEGLLAPAYARHFSECWTFIHSAPRTTLRIGPVIVSL